ncbi:MAG: hypothetical protein V1874_16280 [Spirochaetota bacterium]
MKKRNLHIKIVPRDKSTDELAYWQSKTPEERFNAAEELRNHFYIISGHTELPRIEKAITIRTRYENSR